MIRLTSHITFYYIVWFTCIFSAVNNSPWLGFATAAVITAIQYYWQFKINQSENLFLLIVLLSILGLVFDSALISLDLIKFRANPFFSFLSPPWMIALWMNFAVLLYIFFRQYFSRVWLMFLFSVFGFPLAYGAGVHLGAASLTKGDVSLIVITVTWSVVLPTFLYVFSRLAVGEKS